MYESDRQDIETIMHEMLDCGRVSSPDDFVVRYAEPGRLRAEEFVRARWDLIVRVANKLYSHRKFAGREFRKIVEPRSRNPKKRGLTR